MSEARLAILAVTVVIVSMVLVSVVLVSAVLVSAVLVCAVLVSVVFISTIFASSLTFWFAWQIDIRCAVGRRLSRLNCGLECANATVDGGLILRGNLTETRWRSAICLNARLNHCVGSLYVLSVGKADSKANCDDGEKCKRHFCYFVEKQ